MEHTLSRRRLLGCAAASAAGWTLPAARVSAQAQWPTKTVSIIASAAVGGPTDAMARLLARQVQAKTGKAVVVDNKAGASGVIGLHAMLSAPADGHSFSMTNGLPLNQIRVFVKKLPYDPDADFKCVGAVGTGGLQLAVKRDCPANSLAELIELARKRPVSLGSYGPGSYNHMFAQQVNRLFGTRIEPVHYKGEAPMWLEVATGQLDAALGSYGTYRTFLERGELRPVGIAGSTRLPNLPNVPTFVEQGFRQDIFSLEPGWIGLVASSRIPAGVTERMSAEFVETFSTGEGRQLLLDRGLIGAVMSAAEVGEWQRTVGPRWIAMARDLGITPT